MRILVTGASSDEGRTVIAALLNDGHTVVGLSRTSPGITHERFVWYFMDLSDERYTYAIGNLAKDDPIRIVVHCAPPQYLRAVRDVMAPYTGLIWSGKGFMESGLAPCLVSA